jgi:ABC-2 type transport system permease protein
MTAPMQDAAPHQHEKSAHTPTFGSLLRAELLRIRSRRFARWMVVALFLVMALVTVIEFRQTANPTPASISEAKAFCSAQYSGEYMSDGSGGLFDPNTGEPVSIDPSTITIVPECDTVAEAAGADAFGENQRPAVPGDYPDWFLGIGMVVGIVVFIFGATLGGADWSNRTMPALLFWEPRRWRVYLAKVTALAIGVIALLALASVVWTAVFAGIVHLHGTWDDGSTGLVADSARSLVVAAVVCAVAALVGFGIANLTRNTGAALGAAFVYFVIVETAATAFMPGLLPWLFNANLGALVTEGGLNEYVNEKLVTISSLRGGLTLLGYAAVLNLAAFGLFHRRDVT